MQIRERAALLVVLALLLGSCGSSGGSKTTKSSEPSAPTTKSGEPAGPTTFTALPWPLGDRQADRISAANLPQLTKEGTFVHFHAHLDVFVDGQHVEVPQYIGIDVDKQVISPLHTHTTSGILHVEGDKSDDLTLGQLLTEWGVRVSMDCIGATCAPLARDVYVNGVKVAGRAADVVLEPKTEIALVLGVAPTVIPKGYDCALSGPDQGSCNGIPSP